MSSLETEKATGDDRTRDGYDAARDGVVSDGQHGYFYASYEVSEPGVVASASLFTVRERISATTVYNRCTVTFESLFHRIKPQSRDIGALMCIDGAGVGGRPFVSPIVAVQDMGAPTGQVILRDPIPNPVHSDLVTIIWPCFRNDWSDGNPCWTAEDTGRTDIGKSIRLSEGQTFRGGNAFSYRIRNYQAPVWGTIQSIPAPGTCLIAGPQARFGFSVTNGAGVEVDWGTNNSTALLAAANNAVRLGHGRLWFTGPANRTMFALDCHTPVNQSPSIYPEIQGLGGGLTTDSTNLFQNVSWVGNGPVSRVFSLGGALIYKRIVPTHGPRAPAVVRRVRGKASFPRLHDLIAHRANKATVVFWTASVNTPYPSGAGQPAGISGRNPILRHLQLANPTLKINAIDRAIGGGTVAEQNSGGPAHIFPYWYKDRTKSWSSYIDLVPVDGGEGHPDLIVGPGDGSNDIWGFDARECLALLRTKIASISRTNGLPPDVLMQNARPRAHISATHGAWVGSAAGFEYAATFLDTLSGVLGLSFLDYFHYGSAVLNGWSAKWNSMRMVAAPAAATQVVPDRPYDLRYQNVRDYCVWITIKADNAAAAWTTGEHAVGRLSFPLSIKPDNTLEIDTDSLTGNLRVRAWSFKRTMRDDLTLDTSTGVLSTAGRNTKIINDVTWFTDPQRSEFLLTFVQGMQATRDLEGLPVLISNGAFGARPFMTTFVEAVTPGCILLSDVPTYSRSEPQSGVFIYGGAIFDQLDADANLDIVIYRRNGQILMGKITGYTSLGQVTTTIVGTSLENESIEIEVGHLCVPITVTDFNVSGNPAPDPALIFSLSYNHVELACSTGPDGGVAANMPVPVWQGLVARAGGGGMSPKIFVRNTGPCHISAANLSIDTPAWFSTAISSLEMHGTGDAFFPEGGQQVHPSFRQLIVIDEPVLCAQDLSAA